MPTGKRAEKAGRKECGKSMKRVIAAGLLVSLLWGLCACTDTQPAPEESSSPAVTTYTTVNFLDLSIGSLLTREKLEAVTGQSLREPEVLESGTQLYARSEDGLFSVKLNMNRQDRSRFEQTLSEIPELLPAPNLGDNAGWFAAQKTLFVYGRGYALTVSIASASVGEESALLMARELAAAVLEKL